MKKTVQDLTVVENKRLNEQYFLLKLSVEDYLPLIEPGQFVQVLVENSPNTFLRRPISVNFVDLDKNELWLLIQIVGDGTKSLSKLTAGDKLNLIYPLGNTFTLPEDKNASVMLIGGGVGIAPLLMLGYKLSNLGYKNCTYLIGARSKKDLLQLDHLAQYGKVLTTTEDATFGEKGYVTQHSVLNNEKFDAIYSCGPTPMMKAVAKYATTNNIFCEVSLENMMGCGIGACLCCVTPTTEGNLCVCTDGPVFDIKRLKWQI